MYRQDECAAFICSQMKYIPRNLLGSHPDLLCFCFWISLCAAIYPLRSNVMLTTLCPSCSGHQPVPDSSPFPSPSLSVNHFRQSDQGRPFFRNVFLNQEHQRHLDQSALYATQQVLDPPDTRRPRAEIGRLLMSTPLKDMMLHSSSSLVDLCWFRGGRLGSVGY
jgi:hypothetical protein